MPALRYRNVPAAIKWLCGTLGFEKHHVAVARDGAIIYAQLTFGDEIIMLSPIGTSDRARGAKQFDAMDGAETQSCYFLVADADAHYTKAKSAGADVIADIRAYEYGGRGYSCRDPEGHIWNFGTYDPWQTQGATARRRSVRDRAVIAAGLITIVATVAVGGFFALAQNRSASDMEPARTTEVIAAQRRAEEAGALASRQAAQLADAQSAVRTAQEAAAQLRKQLAHDESVREVGERNARQVEKQLSAELGQVRSDKVAALQAVSELRQQLAREASARQAAERSALEAEQRLTEERRTRTTADPATSDGDGERPHPDKPIASQPLAELTHKGEATDYSARTEPTGRGEDAAPMTKGLIVPAGEKPPEPPHRGLSARERELRAERNRAKCRALFPYAACE